MLACMMCDDNRTVFLSGYQQGSVSQENVKKFHNTHLFPKCKFLKVVNMGPRKRKIVEVSVSNLEDETEKYLTNSSKKSKLGTVVENKNATEVTANLVENAKLENNFFDPSVSNVISGNYEGIVSNLLSTSEADATMFKDGTLVTSSSTKPVENLENETVMYFTQPFTASEKTTSAVSSASNAENIIYAEVQLDQDDGLVIADSETEPAVESSMAPKMKQRALSDIVKQMDDPVRNAWVTAKHHKEQLKKSGHSWTTGMWSKEEVEILQRNINTYCFERGIKDPNDIIFNTTKEERKDFYPTIAKDLNRPLFAVYRRVTRMYDDKNHKGRYTRDEVKKLDQLKKIYGHNWKDIGPHLGRSSDSVKDRSRLMKDGVSTGRWSQEEEDRLAEAVHYLTCTEKGDSVTNGIAWNDVANMVKTRTEKQCRVKWLNYLNWKLKRGGEWTKEDDRLLIRKIALLNPKQENDINWHDMSDGWKNARSPSWLRKKWSSLKKMLQKCDLGDMNFPDTVKLLVRIFSEDMFKIWDRPKEMIKFLLEAQNRNKQAERRVLPLDKRRSAVEIEESDNITTTIISQADEMTTAPLFIQSTNPEYMETDLMAISSGEQNFTQHSLNAIVRPRTASESTHTKTDFDLSTSSGEFVCEASDSSVTLTPGTFQLTPTSSEGIFILQTTENSEDTNRFVNITVAPEVIQSVMKMGEASHSQHDNMQNEIDHESVYLTASSSNRDNPVLSSVMHEITVGTHDNDSLFET